MKTALILLFLLASCRGQEQANESAGAAARETQGAVRGTDAGGAGPGTLTGLYEGGSGGRRSQLCMIEKKGAGTTQFGLLVWGFDLHSCSGAGQAIRSGDRLTLRMAGDQSCVVEARIAEDRITLPESTPQGCAYYCGAGARLEGAVFARAGRTEADAMKAKDLADDPLCG